ncbi:hypothetical protein Tco_0363441 [Tanacetum coccineum]
MSYSIISHQAVATCHSSISQPPLQPRIIPRTCQSEGDAGAMWQHPIGQPPVMWHPRQRRSMTGQPPFNHRSTTAGPPVDGGQWRQTTGQPPLDRYRTTSQPPRTTGQRWWLTGSWARSEYLSALGAAIRRAIEKVMQDGLAAGITHGQEGRVLSDVAAFNPSAERCKHRPLMNILRLEEPVAERLGLQESQPHEDQLMVPIHHSTNQTVVGATSLSFSLDVSHNRVQKIRDNIANNRSAFRVMFVSIVEPLSFVALEGTKSTSGTVPETTTALSVTFSPVRSIPPISMDDYEIAHADDQGNAGADVDPFPNVDDVELIIS